MANEMKIHRVMEGPFDMEDRYEVYMLCLAETDGGLEEIELSFDTFDDAYTFKKHFDKSIEPIILAIPSEGH